MTVFQLIVHVCIIISDLQHLKEEKMLNRDLQETNAIESRDKRAKMVSAVRCICHVYILLAAN